MEEQRREQILSAFETCVVRQGLANTSLADVAAEADLPRPLVRYFVGNRDDMVELLITRMVGRAEAELTGRGSHGGGRTVSDVVDFLFDRVFADSTSNSVVDELWYLAARDDEIRAQLKTVYGKLFRALVKWLREDENVNAHKKDVEAVAFTLLSLVYGDVSFRELGLSGTSRARVRKIAQGLVETLTA